MKSNLKNKPNLEWIINQPRTKERIDDAYATILEMKHWFEGFEKELRAIYDNLERHRISSAVLLEEILGDKKK